MNRKVFGSLKLYTATADCVKRFPEPRKSLPSLHASFYSVLFAFDHTVSDCFSGCQITNSFKCSHILNVVSPQWQQICFFVSFRLDIARGKEFSILSLASCVLTLYDERYLVENIFYSTENEKMVFERSSALLCCSLHHLTLWDSRQIIFWKG